MDTKEIICDPLTYRAFHLKVTVSAQYKLAQLSPPKLKFEKHIPGLTGGSRESLSLNCPGIDRVAIWSTQWPCR